MRFKVIQLHGSNFKKHNSDLFFNKSACLAVACALGLLHGNFRTGVGTRVKSFMDDFVIVCYYFVHSEASWSWVYFGFDAREHALDFISFSISIEMVVWYTNGLGVLRIRG